MPVIPATWKAEIERVMVQGQPRQIVPEILSPKIARAKWNRDIWFKQ
jgi:hypothetical protein